MNRNELALEEFGVCLHNSLVPALNVCMFDIYVVIKENHLDLHWTLSHMFIHSKNLVYL